MWDTPPSATSEPESEPRLIQLCDSLDWHGIDRDALLRMNENEKHFSMHWKRRNPKISFRSLSSSFRMASTSSRPWRTSKGVFVDIDGDHVANMVFVLRIWLVQVLIALVVHIKSIIHSR